MQRSVMPKQMVCTICADADKCKRVDDLLAEGGATYERIAEIVGTSKATVYRHSRHRKGAPGAPQGPMARLYRKIELAMLRAERKRDWKAVKELTKQAVSLRGVFAEPVAPAKELAPKQMTASAIKAVRFALGFRENAPERAHEQLCEAL